MVCVFSGYQEALATLVSNENFTLDTANKLYVQVQMFFWNKKNF